MQPLASIYDNKLYLYGLNHVYMATNNHIDPYGQHKYTQIMQKMTSQCIYSQEADACYTKLTLLWYNNAQLPRGGL